MAVGKSVLASLIIEHCKSKENYKTSYFYVREDEPSQNTALAICKGLLRQLLNHHGELLPYCFEKQSRSEAILNDYNVTKSLIELFCDVDMNQFIIIDGLDECDTTERKIITQFLDSIVDKCDTYKPGKIRVLLLSHDLPDMRKYMQSSGVVNLRREDTDRDIHTLISIHGEQLKTKFDLTDDDIRCIESLICARSSGKYIPLKVNGKVKTNSDIGMILFASLVMKNLIEQPNIGYLKREITEAVLPRDLEDA